MANLANETVKFAISGLGNSGAAMDIVTNVNNAAKVGEANTFTETNSFAAISASSVSTPQVAITSIFSVVAGTETCTTNAVTINGVAGVITTESLTTAAGASQAIALTNSSIGSGDMIFCQLVSTASTGTPIIAAVAGSGGATITLYNKHASDAFNNTFVIAFFVVKAAA